MATTIEIDSDAVQIVNVTVGTGRFASTVQSAVTDGSGKGRITVPTPLDSIYHIKITTWRVVENPEPNNERKVILPSGGCIIAVGKPPSGKYLPLHAENSGLPALFDPPTKEPTQSLDLQTYRLESPDMEYGWRKAPVVKGESSGKLRCTTKSRGVCVWDVCIEYKNMANEIITRAVDYLEVSDKSTRTCLNFGLDSFLPSVVFGSDQRGFDRTAQYRLEWPFCPMPGSLNISETNAVAIDSISLKRIVDLACILCDFDVEKLLEGYEWPVVAERLRAEPTAEWQHGWRSCEAIALLSVSVSGAYGGWYNEKWDDMTSPFASGLTQIDCEDQAVQACNFFNNMVRRGEQLIASSVNSVFDMVCFFLAIHYEEAFLACGFVHEHIAKPGQVANPDADLVGHGYVVLSRKSSRRGTANIDLRQCGGQYGVIIESTTPMLPHSGFRFADLTQDEVPPLAEINVKLCDSCARNYNGILNIDIPKWSVEKFPDNIKLPRAVFAATKKYKTCAFLANHTGCFLVSHPESKHDQLVGVDVELFLAGSAKLCPAHPQGKVVQRSSRTNLPYTDTEFYNAIFSPLDQQQVDMELLPLQRISEMLYGPEIARIPATQELPQYRHGTAVLAFRAGPEVKRAATAKTDEGRECRHIPYDSAPSSVLQLPCMTFFIVGESVERDHPVHQTTFQILHVFT